MNSVAARVARSRHDAKSSRGKPAPYSQVCCTESKSIRQQINRVNKDLNALAMGIMEKISQSNDQASAVLTPLFVKAVPANRRGRKLALLVIN